MLHQIQNWIPSCFVLALQLFVAQACAQNGTWSSTTNGSWSNSGSWTSGTIANGTNSTANFTSAITAPTTVSLTSNQTIGNLTFSVAGANGSTWQLTGQTITLSRSSGVPIITTTTSATIQSTLAGTSGFEKRGGQTLTLTGNNTYSGGTTIAAGTLQVNSLNSIGSGLLAFRNGTFRYSGTGSESTTRDLNISAGTATFRIDNAAAHLTFNPTAGVRSRNTTKTGAGTLEIGGAFSGTARITISQGRLILPNANSHSGGTDVASGQLQINSLSSLGSGLVRVRSNGLLDYRGNGTETSTNQLLLDSGSSTFNIQQASASVTFNPGSGTRNRSFTKTGAGTLTMGGTFTGGASLTANGGRLILSGVNTHTGANQVLTGTLQVNQLSGIGTGSLTIRNGGIFDYRGAGTETTSRQLNLNLGASTINVHESSASLIFSSTSGTRNQAFTKTGAGSLQINGAITGGASVTVNGGTLILTASNTYTGGTMVNSGKLILNNATGSGAGTGSLTVANGASVGGNGRFTGNFLANGIVAPGNSIGVITTGATTFNSTAVYDYESDTVSLNGDLLNVNGNLTILSGAQLQLSELASGVISLGSKLSLISYSGIWNGGIFAGYAQNSTFTLGSNQWRLNYSDTSAGVNGGMYSNFITITAVPEPTALILVGAMMVSCGLVRRRVNRAPEITVPSFFPTISETETQNIAIASTHYHSTRHRKQTLQGAEIFCQFKVLKSG